METHIKLGRIWGIPIGLHSSWFLIAVLVTFSLAAGYFPREYPGLSSGLYWLLGALTAVLFFGSVLAHELAHAWVAQRERVPVRGITLFMFGGVAQIEQEPRTPGAEFRIAIAGPVLSLALAALFEVLWLLDRGVSDALAAPSIWLARINLSLALFNMIPGFPLDGGRVLRAVVWAITGNVHRATRIAGGIGQLVAGGFMLWGALTLLLGGGLGGLWMIVIGWFLQSAARGAVIHTTVQEKLRGVTVGQIRTYDFSLVPGTLSVRELVEDRMMLRGQRCFVVTDTHGMTGLITPAEVAAAPREQWSGLTAGAIMVPAQQLVAVSPEMDLMDALAVMDRAQVREAPVVVNQQVIGVLSREQIAGFLRLRAELRL